ncbi:MAG: NTP transferase domain-containing protein [Methanoregula sp.]|nr:NTP transferase domain-containing protein [Methanoregula sp.]
MYALIMAGGAGVRLNLGEKPLILIDGHPLISYVINAFKRAGCTPVVAVSVQTPMTLNWCRAQGIESVKTDGAGYIDDMVSAVTMLEEEKALFVSVSDIPCIIPEIIHTISESYISSGKEAASTWVPASAVRSCREAMPYREEIHGFMACPAGVNILRGDIIAQPQDELQILLDEPRLALNVNTRADLADAEVFLKKYPSRPG